MVITVVIEIIVFVNYSDNLFNLKCLNHWDCCSNSCMSYMYRCTRGYNVYPYPFLGVSYKPTVTLDDILAENVGNPNALPSESKPYFVSRFGGEPESTSTEVQIILKNSQETTTLKNEKQNNNGDLLENRLAEILGVPEKHNNEEVLKTTEADISSSTVKPSNDEILKTTESTVSTSTVKAGCSEIGVKVLYS